MLLRKILCVVLLLFGVCCIITQVDVLVNWEKTTGKVTALHIMSTDEDNNPTRYKVSYLYKVDGKSYYGEGSVKSIVSGVGSKISVYYDRSNVSASTPANGLARVLGIGVSFVLGGLIILASCASGSKKQDRDTITDDEEPFMYTNYMQGFYL